MYQYEQFSFEARERTQRREREAASERTARTVRARRQRPSLRLLWRELRPQGRGSLAGQE